MNNSSLSSRASAALFRLAEAEQRAQDAAEVSAIENARARADRAGKVLAEAMSARTRLVEQGVAVAPLALPKRKEASDSRRALRTAAAAFSDPEIQLTNRLNGESVQKGLKRAESVGSALVRALNTAVESERVRLRPSGLDSPIPDVPGKESIVVKLTNLKRTLDAPVDNVTPDDLPQLLEKMRRAAETWTNLRPTLAAEIDRLPAAVQAFVHAAGTDDGAPWSLLTSEVRMWLDVEGRGEAYRVRRC
jgi:hypothetical protein